MQSLLSMKGRNAHAFSQPAAKPRFQSRETCALAPNSAAGCTLWTVRARPANLVASGSSTPADKKKKESWRLPPVIPAAQPRNNYRAGDRTRGFPLAPPGTPVDPDLKPTLDRIIYPWEASMTAIEWAVSTFLATEHPEIYDKLMDLALRQAGLLGDEPDEQRKDKNGPAYE